MQALNALKYRGALSLLQSQARRNFSIVAPSAKLVFIDHPRYGKVYPVVCINEKEHYFKTAKLGCFASSVVNTSIIYQLFIQPIFIPTVASVICNPLFFLPSFMMNYVMWAKYYIFFYNRSFLLNMYLKPNGRQIIVETLDGESKVINNMDIFKAEPINTRFSNRIDFYHGANNYIFIHGNSHAFDNQILTAVLTNNFVDVNNVAYDYDVTKEFTWDFKELVEIKKRRTILNRFYKPTLKVLHSLKNAKQYEQNKKEGVLKANRKVIKPYQVFSFFPDQYEKDAIKQQQIDKYELQRNFAGSKNYQELEQKKIKTSKTESLGRRVQNIPKSLHLSK